MYILTNIESVCNAHSNLNPILTANPAHSSGRDALARRQAHPGSGRRVTGRHGPDQLRRRPVRLVAAVEEVRFDTSFDMLLF